MKTKEQTIPKWFKGEIYTKGDVVENRFGGESVELNALELSIYDYLMGCVLMMENGVRSEKLRNDINKGLGWFLENNAHAYYVLLD